MWIVFRLLADGDLGGPETNRTFRLKLREDVAFPDSVADDAEVPEEELEDNVSQAHARRVEAIKWFMEHVRFMTSMTTSKASE